MTARTVAGLTVPPGWQARAPLPGDLADLIVLRGVDQKSFTGSSSVDAALVESEAIGPASWTRHQAVVVDTEGRIRAWVVVHDRAAGRTMVALYIDRTLTPPDLRSELAAASYAWAAEQGLQFAQLRGRTGTRLDASPYAEDLEQRDWLGRAGYDCRRRWLNMTRPVVPGEDLPPVRAGVTIRPVERHPSGLPVAEDLQTVHRMLEESFQDHFNSYRESFPEFTQRLREDPSHRWDHWWLAFVDDPEHPDAPPLPAGAVVCSVLGANASGAEGTYVEYIGVNRLARGRGVAKGLLYTVIGDAADRGRDRVGLEVDADSPTNADQLYRSMGWETDYLTESWFRDL